MRNAAAMLIAATLALCAHAAEMENLVLGLLMEDAGSPEDISDNPTAMTVNGVLASTAGRFGRAIDFDGNNSNLIEIEHADKLAGLEAFTITAWFKCEGVGELEGMSIISKRIGHQNGDAFNIFLWGGGKIHARVNGKGQVIGPTVIENGRWYHLAYLFDANGGDMGTRLLLDGQEEGSNLHGDPMTNADESPIWIGELDANRGFAWKGALDEITIWNVVLEEAEIADLAESGLRQYLSVDPRGRLALSWGRLKSRL